MANATVTLVPAVANLTSLSPRVQRLVSLGLRAGLVLGSSCVLFSYAILAIAHIGDRYQLNFCSSIYASLAAYLNGGLLYPELYDGSHYGGTRYMPLEFAMHAVLARLTGEYLISGKALTYTLTLLLGVAMWSILRSLKCPRSVAIGVISFVFLTESGYLAFTTIRGDLLPVVCQLAAVWALRYRIDQQRVAVASFLCALAVMSKFSAIWGPAAITAYLMLRDRRSLLTFVALTAGAIGVAIFACDWLTAGRMHANFAALSVAGVSTEDILFAPIVLCWKLGRNGFGVVFLVPAFVVELTAAAVQRRSTIFHLAAYACLAMTLLIYTDRGSDSNHLLDLIVLAAIMTGSLWGAMPAVADNRSSPAQLVIALAMLWVLYTGWVNTLVFPVVSAVSAMRQQKTNSQLSPRPLATVIGQDETVLAEDAWIELSRGRTPVVLDPYAVARMSVSNPEWTQPLAQRVAAREFAFLVLLQRMDDSVPTDRYRWEDRAFGHEVVAAMRDNYQYLAEREGYVVYVPRGSQGKMPRPEP
jgi:hypothetical protein